MTHSMDRFNNLNSQKANSMYELQAEIIKENNLKYILDVGCKLARPLEWLDKNITYHGFDIVPENKERLAKKFPKNEYSNTKWLTGDWNDPPFDGIYDCIIFGGVMYYNKDSVVDLIQKYIEKYQPKKIIICDIDYDCPTHWCPANFEQLKSDFKLQEHKIKLPDSFYGMNKRVIFDVDVEKDLMRKSCLLKDNPYPLNRDYDGWQAPTVDESEMMKWVYLFNTEPMQNVRDHMKKSYVLDYWVGVASGFKPYYTLSKFGTHDNTKIIYADISLQEIKWRQHFDSYYDPNMKTQELVNLANLFVEQNPDVIFKWDVNDIYHKLEEEKDYLEITQSSWIDMWEKYTNLEKIYLNENIIDNIHNVLKHVEPGHNTYLWTSNAWDWHQFRYSESEFNMWFDLVKQHLKIDPYYDGKMPPFSSMV